jgi:uncharacterized protein
MNINEKLKKYIEQNVFPQYTLNDEAHQMDHINYVLDRCDNLSKNMDINSNMLYVIAAYHDIGHHINSQKHEMISAQMMYHDNNLKQFFNEKERLIMKEAIEDHRASLKKEPRSIYGKILSSADRNIDVNDSLKRIYIYSTTHYPKLSKEKTLEECYHHTLKKFGKNGYANFFVEDIDYDNYLKEFQQLLNNKEEFMKRLEIIISSKK